MAVASKERMWDRTKTTNPEELREGECTSSDHGAEKPSPRRAKGVVWILVVLAINSTVLLSALDNTIVADVVPSITESLGRPELLPWLSVGYMMGGVCLALPLGKLFGLYNVKWLYILSLVLFMAGSALCGAAPSMNAIIVGRVIAGMAGTGMYLGVVTLISVNTSDTERPMYLALVGLVFGIGTCVGPLIGGAFAESAVHWRFAFYMNVIIGGAFAPVCLFMLPTYDPRPGTPFKRRAYEFDFLGSILSIGAFVFTVIGINFGGTLYKWSSATVIVMLVLGAVCCALFFLQQKWTLWTTSDTRVFPLMFLKRLEYVLLFLLTVEPNIVGFTGIYYIPLFYQFVKGTTPVVGATRILPLVALISVTILVNGAFLSKFGFYKPWYVCGTAMAVVGAVLLSRIDVHTSTGYIYGAQIVLAFGVGCHIQSGYAVIQIITEPVFVAYAITYMMVAQLLGMTLGLSVTGTMFVNIAISRLSAVLPDISRQDLTAFLSGTRSTLLQELSDFERTHALDALTEAIRNVFIFAYSIAALGFVLSWGLKNRVPSGEQFREEAAAHTETLPTEPHTRSLDECHQVQST